jgi:hypothetical protein
MATLLTRWNQQMAARKVAGRIAAKIAKPLEMLKAPNADTP